MLDRFAVIMAGGSGTRLWPLSREAMPKQFIAVDKDKSMLAGTIDRLCAVVAPEKCFVATNKKLAEITRETVSGLIPPQNIIEEPMQKDTSACVAYSAMYLRKQYGPGLLCCVPADGYVKDKKAYAAAIAQGIDHCEQNGGLALVGLIPTCPATGYGYMRVNPDTPVSPVYAFKEKPDEAGAEQMVASGNYLWNGGIFMGELDAFIAGVREHLPMYAENLGRALESLGGPGFNAALEAAYGRLDGISFDKGVLERMKQGSIYAVRGTFDWDDIGSLDALARITDAGGASNIVLGNHCGLDTEGCVIYGTEDVIAATIGLRGIIVAVTKDAVLVAPREKAQEVKELVKKLKAGGFEKFV